MRFEVGQDGSVELPLEHPLAENGVYPTAALLELAAQLAGRLVQAAPGHGGMLVEVSNCTFAAAQVPAGTRVAAEVIVERGAGVLQRYHVRLPGILDAHLTLMIAGT